MSGKGAAEWPLEYPIIEGDSLRGRRFKPREKGSSLHLQLFGGSGTVHYQPVWCELNGHAFNVYNAKSDEAPAVRFDVKEIRVFPAVKGLPGKELDLDVPMFGVISRYHRLQCVDSAEVPLTQTFFFECDDEAHRDEWLEAFLVNCEWALRFSGLFYPRGSALVQYSEGMWKLRTKSNFEHGYLKSGRLHISMRQEGAISKKGAKFSSGWKSRWLVIKGTTTLEYYQDEDDVWEDPLGTINLSNARIVLICHDVLKEPVTEKLVAVTAALGQKAFSRLQNQRGSKRGSHVPANNATSAATLYWFAVSLPDRSYVFRATDAEDLEKWVVSLRELSSHFQTLEGDARSVIKASENDYSKRPTPIVYKFHPLEDVYYPKLDRDGPIPGRPSSGNFDDQPSSDGSFVQKRQQKSAKANGKTKATKAVEDNPFDAFDDDDDDFGDDSFGNSDAFDVSGLEGGDGAGDDDDDWLAFDDDGAFTDDGNDNNNNNNSSSSRMGGKGKGKRNTKENSRSADKGADGKARGKGNGKNRSVNDDDDNEDDGFGLDSVLELDEELDVLGIQPSPRGKKTSSADPRQRLKDGGSRTSSAITRTPRTLRKKKKNKKEEHERATADDSFGDDGDGGEELANGAVGLRAQLEATKKRLKEKEKQLQQKMSVLEKLKAKFDDMKDDYREKKKLVLEQEEEIEELHEELALLKRNQKSRANSTVGGAAEEQRILQLERELKAKREELELFKLETQEKIELLEEENVALGEEVDKGAGAQDASEYAEVLEQEVEDMKVENATLQGEVEELERLNTELEEDLDALRLKMKQAGEADERVAQLQARAEDAEAQAGDLEEAVNELEALLAERQAEIEELEAQAEEARKIPSLEKAVSSATEKAKEAKRELKALQKHNKELERLLDKEKRKLQKEERKSNAESKDRAIIQQLRRDMLSEVERLNAENEKLLRALHTAEQKAANAATTSTPQQSAAPAAAAEDPSLALEVAAAQQQVEDLTSRMEALTEELEESYQLVEERDEKVSVLEEKVAELEAQLEELETQNSEITAEAFLTRKKLKKLQNAAPASNSSNASELAKLREKLSTREKAFQEMKQDATKWQSEKKFLIQTINDLKQEVTDLGAENAELEEDADKIAELERIVTERLEQGDPLELKKKIEALEKEKYMMTVTIEKLEAELEG